jgi:hypothetical protein
LGGQDFEHEELGNGGWEISAVDSVDEASAEIRGGVPAVLWTRPVEHGQASCEDQERLGGRWMTAPQ